MPITMEPHSGPSLVGMLKQAWEAMKAPGKAYNEGMTPDEMIKAGNDFAMTMGAGGSLVPKPGNSLGIFGGRLAKTANLEKLADAEKFEKAGIPADTIWKATGWGRGKDGQWRFEIDDKGATLKPNAEHMIAEGVEQLNASDVFHHPKLYEAYPQLAKTEIVEEMGGGVLGSAYGGKISLRPFHDKVNSTMLHEMQHEVQEIENFAKGNNASNPIATIYNALQKELGAKEALKFLDRMQNAKNPKLLYKNSAGEVEARAVQARQNYSPLQRALRSPWQDEDVPRNLQLPFGYK